MTIRRIIPVIQRPSPNHNERKTPVDMIVIHYTGMSALPDVLDKLTDATSELSAHFVVDIDGRIFQLVDENRRAWHAGVSNWQGQRDINSRSIGIEIMNNGKTGFTVEQITSVRAICRKMMSMYDIPPHNVVGHSDVAPGRKQDPGHLFPWTYLAQFDIGLWPEAGLGDYFATVGKKSDLSYIRDLLARLGYGKDYSPNPTPSLRDTIAAFQRRYEPDAFTHAPKNAGIPTHTTVARMRACVRAYEKAEAEYRARLTSTKPATKKPQGPKP